MTLPREQVCKGLVSELEEFERLIRSLSPQDLEQQTRCEGWAVRDVVAHVVGTQTDVTQGRLEGLGTPEVHARQAAERAGRSAGELADELHAALEVAPVMLAAFDDEAWAADAGGGLGIPLGEGVEALWYDAYVHNADICAALGRPIERGDGLWASVSHVADLLRSQGWGPATLALDGMPEVEVGSGGRRIEGDPYDFVLVATGRANPATFDLDESVNVYR